MSFESAKHLVKPLQKNSQKTRLTDRFFMIFAFFQLIGVFSILFPLLFWVYLSTWPLLALALAMDFLSLSASESFSAEAEIPRSPELAQKFEAEFKLYNPNAKILALRKKFLLAPQLRCLQFEKQEVQLVAKLKEGQIYFMHRLQSQAVRLGYEKISQLTLELYSRLGLCFRRLEIPINPVEYRVFPSHHQVSEQSFHEMGQQQKIFQQGNRKIVRSQVADQFHSIRPYQYPDPLRHIDPRKSAKYSSWMTRTYDTYLEHHLIIALDVGRSMLGNMKNSQKLDYYLAACLSLAEHANRSRDRMSFFAFSQKNHFSIKNTRHLEAWKPVFAGHPQLQAREEESNFEIIYPTLTSLTGQRSILVLLADLSRPSIQSELLQALKPVIRKHLTVVLSLIDEEYYLNQQINSLSDPLKIEDYNRLLYSYWINENIRNFQQHLAALGGGVLLVPEKDWLGSVEKLYTLLRLSLRI